MTGVCGWVRAAAGEPPAAGPGASLDVMTRALSHRGPIASFAWPTPSAEPGPIAADTAYNPPAELERTWAGWSSDPAAFASRLDGSFAVAALDRRRGRLVLARDRLGEKPLYYAASPSGVGFASEIKALRAAGLPHDPSLDPEALDAYLAFTYVPAPRTIFAGVRKVPAGHCVTIDLQALAAGSPDAAGASRYWDLPARIGENASPAEMLRRLEEALARRLPRGGDIAAFLSGGLDSGVVAVLAARLAGPGRPLRCWSAAFREERLDESHHARRVAALAGAEHREILLRDVEPEMVLEALRHLDEPMADAAVIPTWMLAREAAGAGAASALTGDGADALLAGDHWFRRVRSLDRLERLPRALRLLRWGAAALAGPARRRKEASLAALAGLPQAVRYLSIREKWTWQERRAVYAPELGRRVDPSAAEATYLDSGVVWRPGDSVDAAMRLDARHGLPEDLLMKGDKMGMAHGLETRSPFMDHRFVEWCAALGMDLLLRGGVGKRLLKEAAAGLLPRDLIHRRKQGLQVPIGRWLRGPLRPLTEAAFDTGTVSSQGIFDPEALSRLRRRFEAAPTPPALDGKVWQIVAFQSWLALERASAPAAGARGIGVRV
ncbi:MAG TPA: asparagine synthase-related protein [Candidatus Polarisedimenticolia bacterium]|nr:asparagine synthase-related protein [Candidatus Polarisedimenticolia bacterium]